MKKISSLFFLLVVFGLGIWISYKLFNSSAKEFVTTDSTVLLEKVEQVCKLVTVEGNFNELYDETNIRQFNLYIPLAPMLNFSKKATLRVKGKVLVGYDMDRIQISADSTNRVIRLSNLPEPEILSIDHEVEYRNLEESWFNSFSEEDYTNLNANAKEVLKQKALESRLLDEAKLQGNQMIDVIRFMAESAGWQLRIQGEAVEQVEEALN